jgi:hypothetical protein
VPLDPSPVVPVVSSAAVAVSPELLPIASDVLLAAPDPVVSPPVGSVLVGGAVESLEESPGPSVVPIALVVLVPSLPGVVSVDSTPPQAERAAPSRRMPMSVTNDGCRMGVKLGLVGAMTRGARDTGAA